MSHCPFESMQLQMNALVQKMDVVTHMLEQMVAKDHPRQEKSRGIDLAMRITGLAQGSVYNLVWKRKIPHYKKNKKIYFDEQELLEWIKEGKRVPR